VEKIDEKTLQQPNETAKAYRLRLYKNKELYRLNNVEIGQLCNEAFGVSWDESAHRKKTKNYIDGYSDAKSELGTADQQLQMMIEEAKTAKREAQRELMKIQTEKLEYNRWQRELSRDELITEKIVSAISGLDPIQIPKKKSVYYTNKEGCLLFGDAHYGTEFELLGLSGEIVNSYSPEIFEKRMWSLLNQTIDIIEKEKINVLHVFEMGDFSDGLLRVSQLRLLKYGVVESTVKYADFICNWLNELSKYVHIKFQMVRGNHTELRMLGQPKGTFKDENMDIVVRSILKERLKNNKNFEFIENPTKMIFANICGFNVLGIHGEEKNMEKAIKDFSHTYNVKINFLIAGHLHHSKSETVGIDCDVINVPSIIGVDHYALSLNKSSNASANLLILEQKYGEVMRYSIKLDRV